MTTEINHIHLIGRFFDAFIRRKGYPVYVDRGNHLNRQAPLITTTLKI